MDLEIRERDEAGNLTATYIGSSTDQGKNRLDIIVRYLLFHYLTTYKPISMSFPELTTLPTMLLVEMRTFRYYVWGF